MKHDVCQQQRKTARWPWLVSLQRRGRYFYLFMANISRKVPSFIRIRAPRGEHCTRTQVPRQSFDFGGPWWAGQTCEKRHYATSPSELSLSLRDSAARRPVPFPSSDGWLSSRGFSTDRSPRRDSPLPEDVTSCTSEPWGLDVNV